MIEYPNILNDIFDKLDKENAKAIIIGGFIRDNLLNIRSNDVDVEIYNISTFKKLENILKEFGEINSVGKNFGVCKLKYKDLFLDFTLPRIDSKITSGHTGFDIEIKKDLDFREASKRRDFTINAIGYDVVNKKLLDPFNGLNDLKNKTLKMVDTTTFIEDPLRVLRAVQFCARFNLSMDRELFLLCKNMVEQNMLSQLPKERIYAEIKKLLLKAKKPSFGFKLLNELGALKYFLQCKSFMKTLDNMAELKTTNTKTNEVLMLASLCYSLSSNKIKNLLLNFSNDKELLQRVLTLVKNIDHQQKQLSDYEIYKLATFVNIEELTLLHKAIYSSDDTLFKRAKELGVLNKKTVAILMGRDLILFNVQPSPIFTKILNDAYEAQMHKEFSSHKEGIIWLKNRLSNLSS